MREQLTDMLKSAMKAGDKRRVATVRLIQAALKDRDIEARGAGREVSDDDILSNSRYHKKAEIRILIDDATAGSGTSNVVVGNKGCHPYSCVTFF